MQEKEMNLPNQSVFFQKQELRKKIKALLKDYCKDKDQIKNDAIKVKKSFLNSKLYKDSEIIFAYSSTNLELSLDEIILEGMRSGKRIALPKSNLSPSMSFYFLDNHIELQKQLVTGAYGIREPRDYLPCADKAIMSEQVAFIVPALAFSVSGERLGHGKGYYDFYFDRILKGQRFHPLLKSLVGICYDFQLLDFVPVESHDVPVSQIITPKQIKKIY